MLLRHLASILLLPFIAIVLVPYWLVYEFGAADPTGSTSSFPLGLAGVLLFAIGLLLFSWCVSLFARVGGGTLAPWDPTTSLVVVGPYQYVRNPMIAAVILMLAGEALFASSAILGTWAAIFALVNHFYFIYSEEPGLEKQFGKAYLDYKARVPRWIPRKK